MSQSVIGALRVNLGLDAAQFNRGAKQAESTTKRLGSQLQKVGAAISAVGAGMALAIRGQINAADDLAKASARIGVPVEALSQLRHAAELSGVSVNSLDNAMQRLSRGMVQNAGRFKDLDVVVRGADGQMRATVDVLQDVADRLAEMPEGAERTALAIELLGRNGAEMLPMLQGGSSGIRQMMEEADRLGLTLDSKTAKAAEAFNDNLLRLRRTMTGFARQITAALLPVLESITDTLADVVRRFGRLSPEMQTFAAVTAAVTAAAGPLLAVVGTLVRSLGLLRAALIALTGPVGLAVGLFTVAAGAAFAYATRADDSVPSIDGAKDAQDKLNEALRIFAETGAPAAGREAIAHARNLKEMARAAVVAAEAQLEVNRASLESMRAFPGAEDVNPAFAGVKADFEASKAELERAQGELSRLRQKVEDLEISLHDAGDAAFALDEIVIQSDRAGRALRGASSGGDELAEKMRQLEEEARRLMAEMERSASQVGDAFESVFVSFVTGAQNARQAIGNLLRDLARLYAQSAFRQLMGAGGSGILGAIAPAAIPAFAGGTNFAPGGLALVGERGPELVNLPRGSRVRTASETRGMMGGHLIVELRGDIDARIAQGAENVVIRRTPGIVRESVSRTIATSRKVPIR